MCYIPTGSIKRVANIQAKQITSVTNSCTQKQFYNVLFSIKLQRQYVFLYDALLEAYLYGDTAVEAKNLKRHVWSLTQEVQGTGVTEIAEEFNVCSSYITRGCYNLTAYKSNSNAYTCH